MNNGDFMKLNRLLIIALILFALICLPISFASDCDLNAIGDTSSDSSIDQINANSETNFNQGTDLNSEDAIGDDLDYDSSIADTANSDDSIDDNLDSANANANPDASNMDDSNLNNGNIVNPNSENNNKVEHVLGDGNTIDYNSPNLNTNFTNLDVTFTNSNTIFVNASYTGTQSGTMENPFRTINAAFNQFSSNSNTKTNIFLARGSYQLSESITISKSVNIVGEDALNTIISGRDNYQIFYITPPKTYGAVSPMVRIFNLTFSRGSSYYGGAIYINESGVNFVNVNFINNTANYYVHSISRILPGSGGAVYIDKAFVKFYNASFIDNKAIGMTDAYAGALFNDMGEVTIINSKFIHNSISGENGAGGAIYDYSGILVLFNSSIVNNTVNTDFSMGGGIATWATHNAYILNSSLDSNRLYGAYTFGSAMINKANNLIISNTTISNNLANGISDINGTFFNLNGFVNSSNLQFENNTANDPQNLFMCLENQLIIERAFDDELLIDLPSKYDLRDYGWVTPVKDQGGSGSCWAFSTLAAVESYLLKYENKSYDFSENNMKNLMGYYGLNGTDWPDGGNHYMSLAYLLRWSGPVNESQDPFDDSSHSSYSNLNPTKHVQDVLYIPVRLNYLDINQIKAALMTYGALYTTIHADDSFQFAPDYYLDVITQSNHAITLIGWDDDYSADNFEVKPPGDGAFIIKNSWGTDFGYEGYWYISYYDKSFAGYGLDTLSAMAIVNVEDSTNYKTNYQYDILGNTFESIGFGCSTAWFANQFVAKNNNPLSAFGLYTYGDSSYLVNITVNGVVKYIQEGTIKGAGYHTIKLDEFVELTKNDVFRVAVKLTTPISLFPVAIESQRADYSSGAEAEEGQSFISPDGINWYDLASYNDGIKFYQYAYTHTLQEANVCLKAYAAGFADVFLNLHSNTTVYYRGDSVEITLTITNEGDYIEDINISAILESGVSVKSVVCYKGSFNFNSKVWHLDNLTQDESVVLKLKLGINKVKDIITTSFNFAYSGFIPSNFNSSVSMNIYYGGTTSFVQLEDITSLAKSQDEVLIKLLDWNSSPLANQPIVVSLVESETDGDFTFAPLSLITDQNGYISFPLDLLSGNYKFLASFNGNGKYDPSNMTFNVNVYKLNTGISMIGDYDLSNISTLAYSNDELKFCLLDENSDIVKNKTIHLTNNISEESYDLVSDEDGYFKFNLNLASGPYEFLASFDGNDQYNPSDMAFNVSAYKLNSEIKVLGDYDLSNISTLVYSNDELKFYLLDENLDIIKGKTIRLTNSQLNQVYDLVSDEDGYFKFNLNLSSGSYNFNLNFSNDDLYLDSSLAFIVNVMKKDSPVISIEKTLLNVYESLMISLKDTDGNPLAGEVLKITLLNSRGVQSSLLALTDDLGLVELSNLYAGTYNIGIVFENDEIYDDANLISNFTIGKKETQIIYSDMITTAIDSSIEPGTGEYFEITLKDGDGNNLANKAVLFGFNGKVYNKTTDERGMAKLQINLQRADIYTFGVCFLGDDEYNGTFAVAKITVKKQNASLTVPNKSYKASAKTKTIAATFKSASGKVVAGKKVSFTVNGKTYTATTDAKGIAKVNVSLNKKGTYSFTAKFAGDNTYAVISKTAKLTLT